MKKIIYTFFATLSILLTTSCNNDEAELIAADNRNIEVNCGYDFEIPVLTTNWTIEGVQDLSSGEAVLDTAQNSLTLKNYGEIKASNGWLALERNSDQLFILRLKENFSDTIRHFSICINDNGQRDYITVKQGKGKNYKLIEASYQEIDSLREVYRSSQGCHSMVLTNHTSEPIWQPCDYIFKDVVHSSQFESDEPDAFAWMGDEELSLSMPDLVIDNENWFWDNTCVYKQGISTKPFIKSIPNSSKLLTQPYSTTYLEGKISYCKRVCNYTFTIQNESTGTRFDVHGVWTQIFPFKSETIISDKN